MADAAEALLLDIEATYLEATREILQKHGGLWFLDESYVISRRRP
jgi:hypothetical protein